MKRRGALTTLALTLCVASCAGPTTRRIESRHGQQDATERHCRNDLILVDAAPDPASSTFDSNSPAADSVPPSAIAAARRCTVAVRGIRTRSGATSRDSRIASEAPGRSRVEGTGIALARRGLILTNHHVVRGTENIEIWPTNLDGFPPGWLVPTR